jgi:hypothetical protein
MRSVVNAAKLVESKSSVRLRGVSLKVINSESRIGSCCGSPSETDPIVRCIATPSDLKATVQGSGDDSASHLRNNAKASGRSLVMMETLPQFVLDLNERARLGIGDPGIVGGAAVQYIAMDDDKVIAILLDLAKQHIQRGRELEDMEWKINFSIWALLAGIAYLWLSAHLKVPEWVRLGSPLMTLLPLPLIITFVHASAMWWFAFRSKREGALRDDYRRKILKLLNLPVEGYPTRPWRRFMWIWAVAITLILGIGVVTLVLNADSLYPPTPIEKTK